MEVDINTILYYSIPFLLLICATSIIFLQNLLTATILLSIFSFLMAAQYLILGAPDVAITEAAVGAGVSTILLLLAISLTTDREKKLKGNFIVPGFVFLSVFCFLIYSTLEMPEFGAKNSPSKIHLSPYFIEQSFSDIGIPNVVTSILASYRGFDTFGETVVIFAAGVVVLMLLGNFRGSKN